MIGGGTAPMRILSAPPMVLWGGAIGLLKLTYLQLSLFSTEAKPCSTLSLLRFLQLKAEMAICIKLEEDAIVLFSRTICIYQMKTSLYCSDTGKHLEESVDISIGRETKPVDERYRRYQTLLQRELRYQEELGVYQHTILANGVNTHIAVQDEIRRIVRSHHNDPCLTPMLSNLNYVYAFAGLSESGKSSFAQKLCGRYGPSVAFRSKRGNEEKHI